MQDVVSEFIITKFVGDTRIRTGLVKHAYKSLQMAEKKLNKNAKAEKIRFIDGK